MVFSTVFVDFIIFIFASSIPPADVLGAQAVDFRCKPTVRCGRSQLCATSLLPSSSPSSPASYSVSQCAGGILFSLVAKYRVSGRGTPAKMGSHCIKIAKRAACGVMP